MKLALLFLILMSFAIPFAICQEQPKEQPQTEDYGFYGSLQEFIHYVSKTCDRTIIYDKYVQGIDVHVVRQHKFSPEELYQIFLSVIEYHGMIVEVSGKDQKCLKIKRNIVGPWTNTPTLTKEAELKAVQDTDAFVTMVIPLQHIPVREVQIMLRALRITNPQCGNCAGLESANALLITDFAPNVRRIYDIVKLLDQPRVAISESPLPIESQNNVALPFVKGEIFIRIQNPVNMSITLKNDKGHILSIDPQHQKSGDKNNPDHIKVLLTPHLQNNALIHFELEVLSNNMASCDIEVSSTTLKHLLWSFKLQRGLPQGKIIRFTMGMQQK